MRQGCEPSAGLVWGAKLSKKGTCGAVQVSGRLNWCGRVQEADADAFRNGNHRIVVVLDPPRFSYRVLTSRLRGPFTRDHGLVT